MSADPRRAREGAGPAEAPRTAITFVTGNAGKVRELQALLEPLGLSVAQDAGGYPEVQADTLAEVAAEGARHLLGRLAPPFLLEDSGLFVDALRGFPGVYSRHALDTIGPAGILSLMAGVPAGRRGAEFRTHLLYVDGAGRLHGFDGACRGHIADGARGSAGFGFDPVFVPEGEARTFAEMDAAAKNRLSHRGRAVRLFLEHLSKTAAT